ncbi:MAG: DUF2721 domain-containing protein [Pseudomonadota bacterium]
MATIDAFIITFTFIPGVGLLIVSTANRFHVVNLLIRDMATGTSPHPDPDVLPTMVSRSRRLQRALVVLYIAASSFAVPGLIGQIGTKWLEDAVFIEQIWIWLTTFGVAAVVLATILLILESRLAFEWVGRLAETAQKRNA